MSPSALARLMKPIPQSIGWDSWVGRIIGYGLQVEKMDALMDYAMSKNGILTYVGQKNSSTSTVECHLRQLVGLIATSEEFAYR